MRRRLQPLRQQMMARRRGDGGRRFDLSPRARTLIGWVAALALVVTVAIVVGLLGGDADGPLVGAGPSGSGAPGSPQPIAFSTALLPGEGVDPAGATDRFAAGDTFAYSVAAAPPPSRTVYAEVVRTGGGVRETVQEPIEPQTVPAERSVIAFQVPADVLLAAFGAGEYVMRLYLEADGGSALGEGRFTLLASPAPS